ncbi:MAG TPA: 5-(carboxyamino)imidazole ribonucleotide synthase [Firmicutes bacterium]|nr:5-(carboxyamino)imidazole ribonucleotide synthase [Bacillota bacterium]
MSKVILPPATIGIIGGGQLGRMMAISAKQMGYKIAVLEPLINGPLAQIADIEINAAYDDEAALTNLLSVSDVVTYEFENINSEMVKKLASLGYLPQGERPLAITQHRYTEKSAINNCGFKTAPFAYVESAAQLRQAMVEIGYPAILKTVSGGYDGKGQWKLNSIADLDHVEDVFTSATCIVEGFVPFDKEISVIVTRGTNGQIENFPVVENIHENHILHLSVSPANISVELKEKAENIAKQLIEKLAFVGTLAIEMFVVGEDVIINELAPRPHNSGHLTIDACNISQFEQHIRSICGLPLIKPELKTSAMMVNLLGQHVEYTLEKWKQPAFSEAKLHLYGKEELRANRKVGHITFTNNDANKLKDNVNLFLKQFGE